MLGSQASGSRKNMLKVLFLQQFESRVGRKCVDYLNCIKLGECSCAMLPPPSGNAIWASIDITAFLAVAIGFCNHLL